MGKSNMTRRKFGAAVAAGLVGVAARPNALSLSHGLDATSNGTESEATGADEEDLLLVGAFAFREFDGKIEAYRIEDHVPFLIVSAGSDLGQSGAFVDTTAGKLKDLHPYFKKSASAKPDTKFHAMCIDGWKVAVGAPGQVDVNDKSEWWPTVSTIAKSVDGYEYEFDKGSLVVTMADGSLKRGPETGAAASKVRFTFANTSVGIVDGPRKLTDISKFEYSRDLVLELTMGGSTGTSFEVKPKDDTPAWIVNLPPSTTRPAGTCPSGSVPGNVLTHGDHFFSMLKRKSSSGTLEDIPKAISAKFCVPVTPAIEIECKKLVGSQWVKANDRFAAPPDTEFCYQVFL